MHDLIAELNGYREELAGAEQRGDTKRADAVREQTERVVDNAVTHIERLLDQADTHDRNQEDLDAAKLRIEARNVARALPDGTKLPDRVKALRGDRADEAGQETAEQNTPQETATATRGRSGRGGKSGG